MPSDDAILNELRSEAVEDFLKTVYRLQQLHDPVPTTAIAQELNITPPSATDMAKKLADKQRLHEPLLEYTRYKGVRLTPLGEEVALEVLRHHRLIELYLVEALGYTLDEVHDEAERLEHVISEQFEQRIAEFLGNPAHDPHGDPIPNIDGSMPEGESMLALADWPIGQTGIIARLLDQTPEKLQYLYQKGIRLGVQLRVVEKEPFDGVIHVMVREQRIVLSQAVTRSILVIAVP